jgi:AraC-like DNA-binding protein
MDPLAGLLDCSRARGAFALRTVMRPPWSLRIAAESPVTLIAAVAGDVWIVPDEGEAIRVGPGDIAVTRAPDHYTVADSPATEPSVVVHPGQQCRDLAGRSVLEEMTHGVRTWGNDPEGPTVFLVGAWEALSDVSVRLLRALPPVLSLSRMEWESPLVALLCDELGRDAPGQAAVLDRLLDLLLTAVLRTWFEREDAESGRRWRYEQDRLVERALRLMHEAPAHHWTLDTLAERCGASRASLARRFHEHVGEPPMTFLKNWRMAMAADLLRHPDETVSTVADKVGYATPFAFSAAFKRARGMSPRAWRAHAERLQAE